MRESLFVNGPFVAGVFVYENAWNAAEKTERYRCQKQTTKK